MRAVAGVLFRLQPGKLERGGCRGARIHEQYLPATLEVDGVFYLQLEVGEQIDTVEVFALQQLIQRRPERIIPT